MQTISERKNRYKGILLYGPVHKKKKTREILSVSMRNREKHQLGKWDNSICDDAREIWSETIIKEEKKKWKKKVGDKTCEERPMCEAAKPEYNTEQIGVV